MSPIVSIIVPVYNCERFISETLESIVRQTFRDFELLIIDDGSTDDSKLIIKHFGTLDARLKYVYQPNKGVSAARNNGFRQASGKFLAFLDSDDVWLNNNLELKLRKFEEGTFGLVHSDAELINESSEKVDATLQGREGDLLDGLLSWNGTQVPGPSSILVRRRVLDIVGLFDENLSTAADMDLFIRVAAKFRIGRVDQVTWQYRIHSKNMHQNIGAMEHDVLLIYSKARQLGLFRTRAFERRCFSIAYLILSASWWADGRNKERAFKCLGKALFNEPLVIIDVIHRVVKRIFG